MLRDRAGVLRVMTALLLVGSAAAAGVLHRSPWVIALAAPVWTALYAVGKWRAWTAAWRAGGVRQVALAVLTTLPIQVFLVGICYLVGLGGGRLVRGPEPIEALSVLDAVGTALVLGFGLAAGWMIIRLDRSPLPSGALSEPAAPDRVELDIDPTPLDVDTFFIAPGYWRVNASREAMEKRTETVAKPPLAASEDMITAAETRLGVALPQALRQLYRIMNGGHVGPLYVPRKEAPRPVYDDWRGAFSIDYSALAPVERLRTVAEHYDDFTDDPDEIPDGADRLVILQARYGDMTVLDYANRARPRVLITDFDRFDGDPIDVAFDDFDAFFAALRRPRDDRTDLARHDLSAPLGDRPDATRARVFWGTAGPHAFHQNATAAGRSEPQLHADDALVAATEERLGVELPPTLVELWRARNGGGVASRYLAASSEAAAPHEAMRYPVPLEHITTLADLSDRIEFPAGDVAWKQRHDGADRLLVLEADHERAVLLDYRGGAEPAVLLVTDLDRPLDEALEFERWDDLLRRLRHRLGGWDEVSAPHDEDLDSGSARRL